MKKQRCARRDIAEPRNEFCQLMVLVEAVGELGEVTLHVARVAALIHAVDRSLEVVEQNLHLPRLCEGRLTARVQVMG